MWFVGVGWHAWVSLVVDDVLFVLELMSLLIVGVRLDGAFKECIRTALEDILHDVGQWLSLVCWFRLLVQVRSIGAAVVAIVDGGGHVVVIGG